MANDPNRDIVPVKEGFYTIETSRSSIDPRERHSVCKLDRYELEDKYLTLLNEALNLKKLYNTQEDKIKKLSAKLIRLSNGNKSSSIVSNIFESDNKLSYLEAENAKLKDKVTVLKNQLLSHKIGVSSARNRRPYSGLPHGIISYQSECARMRISSGRLSGQKGDEGEQQDYLMQTEEFKGDKKDVSERIEQLEKELASYVIGNKQEKIAENVEHIKVWRQIKQLNDKLALADETNESLHKEIGELKKVIEEVTKNNQEISTALTTERKRLAELDEHVLKAKDSHLMLREKDEQIRDLMKEMKILQQHNNELINLSSRYGQMEHENMELKKKISEQLQDQQSLKNAFTSEKATIVALQNANEQLSTKLQEFQKNMDSFNVELKTLKNDASVETNPSQLIINENNSEVTVDKTRCKKCCEVFEKVVQLEKSMNTTRDCCLNVVSDFTQTDNEWSRTKMKDEATHTEDFNTEPVRETVSMGHLGHDFDISLGNPLSKEKMLKLLEDVQISTSQKSARMIQMDENGSLSIGQQQPHRQVVILEKLLFGDSQF